MRRLLFLVLLLSAGCASQTNELTRFDDLAARWQPVLARSLQAMRAAANDKVNGFDFITAANGAGTPAYFLQCTFSVEEEVVLCEAAAPQKHPEIEPVLTANYRQALTRLGFDTSRAEPHYQMLYEFAADPDFTKLARVLLHALVEGYSFGAGGSLTPHVGTVERDQEG